MKNKFSNLIHTGKKLIKLLNDEKIYSCITKLFHDDEVKNNIISYNEIGSIFKNITQQHSKRHLEIFFNEVFLNTISNRSTFKDYLNEQALSSYSRNKKSIIVFSYYYKNLEHFLPLLTKLETRGFQIIYISIWYADNPLEYLYHKLPAIFIDDFGKEYELQYYRTDASSLFMFLYKNYNVKYIIQDEWTSHPIQGHLFGWPKFPDIPPIYAMRHSLSTFYEMPVFEKNFYIDNLVKYFVWGRFHKNLFFKQSDKVVESGYCKLDIYKDKECVDKNQILLIGQHPYISTDHKYFEIILSLLKEGSYIIKYKPHPVENSCSINRFTREINNELSWQEQERFIILNKNESYADELSSSSFIVTFGSNIVADALALNKPICILPSNYAKDSIYTQTPGKILLFPDNQDVNAKNIFRHIENVKNNWQLVEEFKDGLLSNLFTASDFVANQLPDFKHE